MTTKRGRRSATSLAVVTALPGQRHGPSEELTSEQATIWRAVVATKPTTWFSEDTHPLLAAYCKHVVASRLLGRAIDDFDVASIANDDGLKRYEKLLQMRERESRALTALARSMRLTQQSQLKAETAATRAATVSNTRKPWEVGA